VYHTMPLAFQAEPDRVLRVLGVGPGSDPTLMTVALLCLCLEMSSLALGNLGPKSHVKWKSKVGWATGWPLEIDLSL
jgi:hypothetical protein